MIGLDQWNLSSGEDALCSKHAGYREQDYCEACEVERLRGALGVAAEPPGKRTLAEVRKIARAALTGSQR